MPEVRHGSTVSFRSDPVLADHATTPDSDPNQPARPRAQSQTRSADQVHFSLPAATDGPLRRNQSDGATSDTAAGGLPWVSGGDGHGGGGGLDDASSGSHVKKPMPDDTSASSERPDTGGRRRRSSVFPPITPFDPAPRQSLSYALRPKAEVYYDSRAATRHEWKRRARTLEEYYDDNPDLLPQLPFSWKHGNRRYRLWVFAFIVFVDASAVPVALYYGMKYAGGVPEWIIFAVVTTIWGGPTYLEFAVRTLRLIKKEHFYRPLGANSRWCTDMVTWASSIAIFVLTTLFIVGSAPHDTWLRVVAMAAPSILWSLGGVLTAITLLHRFNIPAPFRISSTAKGEKVHAGAYYFIEDVMAVNARCGRPYREALAARYRASPRFREMLYEQSLFWGIPSLILALILTVIAVIPWVPEDWSYGVCWVVPFLFMFIWGAITVRWCKARMVRERLEWEAGTVPGKTFSSPSPENTPVAPPPA